MFIIMNKDILLFIYVCIFNKLTTEEYESITKKCKGFINLQLDNITRKELEKILECMVEILLSQKKYERINFFNYY